jgi:small subunit ribosomal protein S20
MPIQKAAFKALRQNKKRRERNLKVKNNLRHLLKQSRKSFEARDKNKAQELAKKLIVALDKAAQKKVIKKNRASRLKSRMMKKLNSLK